MKAASVQNSEHYVWGQGCDGWHLLQREDFSIIQERVPPGAKEVMHYHEIARQFFYILDGEGQMILSNDVISLHKGDGLEIAPTTPHRFENLSEQDVLFLVISVPKSHGDRVNLE